MKPEIYVYPGHPLIGWLGLQFCGFEHATACKLVVDCPGVCKLGIKERR